jgi:hypothetical protein
MLAKGAEIAADDKAGRRPRALTLISYLSIALLNQNLLQRIWLLS